jgi:hypothetical protein
VRPLRACRLAASLAARLLRAWPRTTGGFLTRAGWYVAVPASASPQVSALGMSEATAGRPWKSLGLAVNLAVRSHPGKPPWDARGRRIRKAFQAVQCDPQVGVRAGRPAEGVRRRPVQCALLGDVEGMLPHGDGGVPRAGDAPGRACPRRHPRPGRCR